MVGPIVEWQMRRAVVDWAERAAVGASLACLIHCLVLPVLLSALPALSAIVAIPETFHLWVLAFAAPMALIALFSGQRHHRSKMPMWLGFAGLGLLLAGALVGREAIETLLTVAGSLTLATAHGINWRRRHACAC